jgi:pilus assembly protein CpaC
VAAAGLAMPACAQQVSGAGRPGAGLSGPGLTGTGKGSNIASTSLNGAAVAAQPADIGSGLNAAVGTTTAAAANAAGRNAGANGTGNGAENGSTAAAATEPAAATNIRPILIPRPIDTDHPHEYGANFSSEGMNEQATHIVVGRSVFIDTKHRVARIYITNPDVIDSYTASPNQIVVTAKKAGASTLIMWDETGGSKSYLVSSDLNVDMLRESLKQALPRQNIKVIGNETRVVLTGTVDTRAIADSAVRIAGIYSKEVSDAMMVNSAGIKQVRLEVKIVEVDRTKLAQFGFNFFGSGGANPASTTTGQFPSTMGTTLLNGIKTVTTTNPLNFSIYLNRFNIGATLQDLETMQLAQILAEPNITTLSGEKADFLAGGEFPFPIVQSSTTGAPVISLVFKPYGVKLAFTPIVNDDGTIELTVAPEVSALDYTNAVTISGYTIPAISTRRAETQVVLKSGETFAISGLIDKRTTDLYSKTPGAASIPILGQLFKSKGVTHSDNELLVIVTPIVVDPLAQPVPVPPAPTSAVPFLNKQKYDSELPKGATKP